MTMEQACVMLLDSAASLAATYAANGIPTNEVDHVLKRWMDQLCVHGTAPQFIITNAPRHAQMMESKTSKKVLHIQRGGRYKQSAIILA